MNEILGQLILTLGALSSLLTPNLGAVKCEDDVVKKISERVVTCQLSTKERANFKAREIAKLDHKARFIKDGIEIEILDLKTIEGGVEVLAKAWKNGQSLGFGTDGSVEIERFRIFNPPILVNDATGDILKESVDSVTGERSQRRLKENLIEAVRQDLAHTIKIVGKEGTRITLGKVGNTTSTFYPNPDPEVTSVDGGVFIASDSNWTASRDALDGQGADDSSANWTEYLSTGLTSGGLAYISRGFFLFDTAAIGSGATIDSATMSLWGTHVLDNDNDANAFLAIITTTPASNTAIVVGDFDQIGSVKQHDAAQDKDITGFSTTAYTDWTLNATGLGNISKTSITKFGLREGHDLNNDAYNGVAGGRSGVRFYFAEQAGTTNDPKLVVTHTAATPSIKRPDIIWFNED